MFVSGEDIAQIGTVDYVFECGENADPDGRSIVGRNVLAATKQQDPCEYGEKREQELSRDGENEAGHEQ
jgi:hypothetical protein